MARRARPPCLIGAILSGLDPTSALFVDLSNHVGKKKILPNGSKERKRAALQPSRFSMAAKSERGEGDDGDNMILAILA